MLIAADAARSIFARNPSNECSDLAEVLLQPAKRQNMTELYEVEGHQFTPVKRSEMMVAKRVAFSVSRLGPPVESPAEAPLRLSVPLWSGAVGLSIKPAAAQSGVFFWN